MYQKIGNIAYKKDLKNAKLFDKHLNYPHLKYKTIHIAGTNGKGSTSHMLASIFQEAGYTVGLYTSPHLKDFRERIKVNGKMISKANVIDFVKKNKLFLENHSLSFFEMTTGMAFNYFAKKEVDIAIIEVGLGGRLDTTNIIQPEISIITNIGLDHISILGDNISSIAKEKAGIIKKNIPVVIGQSTPETRNIFKTIAKKEQTTIYFSEDTKFTKYESDLKGDYQSLNKQTVLQTINILKPHWKISNENIKKGLKNTIKNTELLGRWQVLNNKPLIICDTAHNFEGLSLVINQLLKLNYKKLHIIYGTLNDKSIERLLSLFPKEATYYFCKPNTSRGLSEKELLKKSKVFDLQGNCYSSVKKATNAAILKAKNEDLIFIGGSTYVVSEII